MRLKLTIFVVILLSGCGGDPFWLPRADRVTIQQGNLLSQRQVSAVLVGMNKDNVRNLLGAPITSTPFHTDRWDYLYTSAPAGSAVEAKHLAVYFDSEQVSKIDSNVDTTSGELPEHLNWWEKLFPPKRERTPQ